MPQARSLRWPPLNIFESLAGIHRVQRVSPTEKNGRRHSSTVVVHILNNGVGHDEFVLDRKDCVYTTFRSSGAGGQHRNKTDSCIRIVHRPTGITVVATEDRSQHVNRRVAEQRLVEILTERAAKSQHESTNAKRSAVFNENRSWTWTAWRDEVINPNGVRYSMKQALKGKLHKLL